MTVTALPLPLAAMERACRLAASQSAADMAIGVQQERGRVLELLTISDQATRLGVAVNVAAVIADGADPGELRAVVLRLATEEGSSE